MALQHVAGDICLDGWTVPPHATLVARRPVHEVPQPSGRSWQHVWQPVETKQPAPRLRLQREQQQREQEHDNPHAATPGPSGHHACSSARVVRARDAPPQRLRGTGSTHGICIIIKRPSLRLMPAGGGARSAFNLAEDVPTVRRITRGRADYTLKPTGVAANLFLLSGTSHWAIVSKPTRSGTPRSPLMRKWQSKIPLWQTLVADTRASNPQLRRGRGRGRATCGSRAQGKRFSACHECIRTGRRCT